jgi:glutathione S-transferase
MYRLHAVDDWASLVVHLVLAEAGLPFERVVHDDASRTTPAYRALSPAGRIPALETPGGPLFETAAILLWLADRHGLAPAPGDPARTGFLSWQTFVATTVHSLVMALLHPYRAAGDAVAPSVCRGAQAALRRELALVEAMLATDAPRWAAPGQASVFTPYLGVLLRWAQAFPWDPDCAVRVAEFPALQALLAAYESRPAVQAAAAAEGLAGRFLTEAA